MAYSSVRKFSCRKGPETIPAVGEPRVALTVNRRADAAAVPMAIATWARGMAMLNPGIHEGFDNLQAWIARIGERPAVKTADDLLNALADYLAKIKPQTPANQ